MSAREPCSRQMLSFPSETQVELSTCIKDGHCAAKCPCWCRDIEMGVERHADSLLDSDKGLDLCTMSKSIGREEDLGWKH